ncbi:MAG: FtsW/RodA/SpoVE family cell cycle protein [Phycisphaeraceae bacterium]|nr:FtsW/RodA/SpoVE family cell cycle protein [Phycisphaeraceae bacterium]
MRMDDLSSLIKGTTSRRVAVRDALRALNPAWLCVLSALALCALGVYSIDLADHHLPREAPALSVGATKQAMFALAGIFAAIVVAVPHYRLIGWLSLPTMIVVLGLLVFLLLPFVPASIVSPRNGTRGWINLRVFYFQPSELAKVAFVLVVAHYLRFRDEHRRLLGLIPLALITAVPVGLIMLEPDWGTALLFLPSLVAMVLAAGARLRHLAIVMAAAMLAAPASWPILRPHQKARIVALVHQMQGDETYAQDVGFQPLVARTLTGAGGIAGVGDASSRALVHYNRLPEAHNDMVFAVVVNRFGLVGGLAVLGLYALWMIGAILTAAMAREPFARLLVVGLSAFIAAQAIINIGMTVGLLPIIGITLPFLSYGGSSVIACWIMTGLILNVALHRPLQPYRPSFEFDA